MKYYFLLLLILPLNIYSQDNQKKDLLIKKYSYKEGNYFTTTNCEYDNKGRIISEYSTQYEISKTGQLIEKNSEQNRNIKYLYYKDSIVINLNGTWDKLLLNKRNLYAYDLTPNEFSDTKKLTTRQKYTYNENSFVIKSELFLDYVTYSYSTINEYFYLNGNIIKEIRTEMNDGKITDIPGNPVISEYEYYFDKINTIRNINFGKKYLGKSNKNLIKKIKFSNGQIENYRYEFDKNGNVIKMIITPNDDETRNIEYNYEYK